MQEFSYGFTYEEMSKLVKADFKNETWGSKATVFSPYYSIGQLIIKKGKTTELWLNIKRETTCYIKQGDAEILVIRKKGNKVSGNLKVGEVFTILPGECYGFYANNDCEIYFFSDKPGEERKEGVKEKNLDAKKFKKEKLAIAETTDFREKYWGSIETIVSKDYCAKKIVMKAGTQNSLEFHCNKYETYWVQSGELKVGIRFGRGENKSVLMKKGDIFNIPPGLMHMKIAITDCVIMEISTKDDDSDSHIVEDGKKYKHKEG